MSATFVAEAVTAERPKPLLRGVSHQLAFFAAWPLGYWLSSLARTREAAVYAAIYSLCLIALLGISALYHRKHWQPAQRAMMRSLDHSTIFLLIAGTYTPICMLGVGGATGRFMMAIIWGGAIAGIAQTLFWKTAPRVLHVGLYVLVGWMGVLGLWKEAARIGSTGVAMHVLGGVLYTLGAVAYARKRPDPFPRVFGYHEIFHALVLIACGCLFDVVRRCLLLS